MRDGLLPALGFAFAAFCVWLIVRIVNRRERWAKWALAAVAGMPVLYVVSFGPACWLQDRHMLPDSLAAHVYNPLARIVAEYSSDDVFFFAIDYGTWGSPEGVYPSALALLAHERNQAYERQVNPLRPLPFVD